jgi:hypothetical protein
MTLFDRLGCVARCFDSFNTRNALQVSCYCEQIFIIRCDFQFCAMFVAGEVVFLFAHRDASRCCLSHFQQVCYFNTYTSGHQTQAKEFQRKKAAFAQCACSLKLNVEERVSRAPARAPGGGGGGGGGGGVVGGLVGEYTNSIDATSPSETLGALATVLLHR